jgi:hypothetical protein
MAHIHFTGTLTARAEEDAYCRHKAFYVRLTDSQEARAYLPARDAGHARRIADAINAVSQDAADTTDMACPSTNRAA